MRIVDYLMGKVGPQVISTTQEEVQGGMRPPGSSRAPQTRSALILVTAIGIAVMVCGCTKRVDVLSAKPTSAMPGKIITVEISQPAADVEYKVMFGEVGIPPMAITDNSVTVMVPPIEPQQYKLALATEKGAHGKEIDFTVEEPPPVGPDEMKVFLGDLNTILDVASLYSNLQLAQSGVSAKSCKQAEDSLQKYMMLLANLTEQLDTLDPAGVQLAAQMLVASGMTEKAHNTSKALKYDSLDYYHTVLAEKGLQTFLDDNFSPASAARLDVLSASLTEISLLVKAAKYGCIAGAIAGALATPATAGASTVASTGLVAVAKVLGTVKLVIDAFDHLIDGAIRTDLKKVGIKVDFETGKHLNPGENASVKVCGTFGTQSHLFEETVGYLIDLGFAGFSHYYPTNDAVEMAIRDLRKEFVEWLADLGIKEVDKVVDIDIDDFDLSWVNNVELDMEYYSLKPGVRLSQAVLFPQLTDFADAMASIVSYFTGDELLHNEPVWTDHPDIASYNADTGKLEAHKAGTTYLHVRPYRYDEVDLPKIIAWLVTLEGWHFLEEDEDKVNVPVKVEVTNVNDPVVSDLSDTPISGTVPGVFTLDGGHFELSVSPVDQNVDLLYEYATVDNFTFSPIQVAHYNDPGTSVASGRARVCDTDVILPGTPGAGINVAILLDSSGSMGSKGSDDNRARVAAAKALVDTLRPGDAAAILDFGAGATSGFSATRLLQDFTTNHDLLYTAIDQVYASGGTPLYQSLGETITFLTQSERSNLALLVLTDGAASDDELFDNVVVQAQDIGLPLFVVGLGSSLDFTQLQALASATEGSFASVGDASAMQSVFESIGVSVSAGRIVVYASVDFMPALQAVGRYIVSGELRTKISGLTIPTPFDFVVDVVSVEEGLALKMVNSY